MVAALCAAGLAAASPAWADELVVGAVRDQDGAVVIGASLAALSEHRAVLVPDRTAADGKVAIAGPSHPVAVLIRAPDSEPLRVAVPAGGAAISAIVRRHRSAGLIPSVADVAALPAASMAEIASVIPYRVAFPSKFSDRWLAGGQGALTIEGLPFYRGDGADATALLPSHAVGALDLRDSLQAPWYGDRAGGGLVDARLFDRADAARATNRDASLLLGRDPMGFAAASWDRDGSRRLVAVRASNALGPVGTTVVALAGNVPGGHYAGAGADLRASTRVLDLGARLALTTDDASNGALLDEGNVADASFDASARGPNAIAVRARWRAERGTFGAAETEHHDAALVFGTTRGNVVRATAAVALAYGDDHSYPANGTRGGFAVLPSVSLDASLGSNWTIHAGAVASTVRTPTYAVARASLGEISLAYADHHRVRAEIVAYAEGTAAPETVNRGFAASLGWELAPRSEE
ncbi:MAG: hypothetical protein JWO66_647, partial [Candidatus Eremiobacteraeota bacterium]|nr:hypothetical protein [Candidatus Eremiobacteraeota bacterium]